MMAKSRNISASYTNDLEQRPGAKENAPHGVA